MGSGGHSYHFPIFLESRNGPIKPPSPLKFNKTWLKDPSFQNMVTIHWVISNPNSRTSVDFWFPAKILKLKDDVKTWAFDKRRREDRELKLIEKDLAGIYGRDGGGVLTLLDKELLMRLEGRRGIFLLERE